MTGLDFSGAYLIGLNEIIERIYSIYHEFAKIKLLLRIQNKAFKRRPDPWRP
jgi:hypothetical protein